MRDPGKRVIPTAEDVLTKPVEAELPPATRETLNELPVSGRVSLLEGVILKREGRVQLNANVHESLYDLMQTHKGGLTAFFKEALAYVMGHIKEVSEQIIVYEDLRKQARHLGEEVRTVACKLEKSSYRQLKALEDSERTATRGAFRIPRFAAACLWVYSRQLGGN